jgi:hypothetical protein
MLKLFLLASLVAGCTPDSPEARLADLPSPKVLGTNTGFTIEYDTKVNCFTLAPEVTAHVDGHAITEITRGGWYNTYEGNHCTGISFNFPTPLDTNEVTAIALADGDSTWNLDITGLAPSSWSVQTPAGVAEGSDVTITYQPAIPGVGIDFIYIAPDGVGISPFASAPTGNTAHIDAGYWSEYDQAPHGSQLQATILVELGPLPAQRCSGPQSCGFITDTPDPANRVTIAIP